jgi:trigger factor
VTDAELTQAVLQQARQYRGQERQFFEYIQKNAAARQQIQARSSRTRSSTTSSPSAQVEEREVSKDELQARWRSSTRSEGRRRGPRREGRP